MDSDPVPDKKRILDDKTPVNRPGTTEKVTWEETPKLKRATNTHTYLFFTQLHRTVPKLFFLKRPYSSETCTNVATMWQRIICCICNSSRIGDLVSSIWAPIFTPPDVVDLDSDGDAKILDIRCIRFLHRRHRYESLPQLSRNMLPSVAYNSYKVLPILPWT